MLCGAKLSERETTYKSSKKGLDFHHWLIDENNIAYGIWLCGGCHQFANRVDKGLHDKYIKLKTEILNMQLL